MLKASLCYCSFSSGQQPFTSLQIMPTGAQEKILLLTIQAQKLSHQQLITQTLHHLLPSKLTQVFLMLRRAQKKIKVWGDQAHQA